MNNNAKMFAIAAHEAMGQKRKYTGEPYWHHCREVAMIVANTNMALKCPEMIEAAWLHDIVEDTKITIPIIEEYFGMATASLVEMVTDISKPEDGNRHARKELDRLNIARATPEGKTIKLADLIDNTGSIIERDPEFAKVYMKEKKELLEVLKEGDRELWNWANEIVQDYFKGRN